MITVFFGEISLKRSHLKDRKGVMIGMGNKLMFMRILANVCSEIRVLLPDSWLWVHTWSLLLSICGK